MGARLLRLVGALAALWLVLVAGALAAAPPLLAVSGVLRGELVLLDLRLNVRHTLLVPRHNGRVLAHAWEPTSGRLVAVDEAPAGTRMRLREPDGAVRTLGQYASRGLRWTLDGTRVMVLYSRSYYLVDPQTGDTERHAYTPPLFANEFFLLPLDPAQMLVFALPQGPDAATTANYFQLDARTGAATAITDLPCGGLPTDLDLHQGSGALAYSCPGRGGLFVRDGAGTADRALPGPGTPGTMAAPRWSPDAAQVLYMYIPAERQGNRIVAEYYLVDVGRGTLRRVLAANSPGGVQWLPLEGLPRGR